MMLDVVNCRPEARTVEDGQGDDGGVSFYRWGGCQWPPTGRCPGATDFLLGVLGGGGTFAPALLSQSVGWFSF